MRKVSEQVDLLQQVNRETVIGIKEHLYRGFEFDLDSSSDKSQVGDYVIMCEREIRTLGRSRKIKREFSEQQLTNRDRKIDKQSCVRLLRIEKQKTKRDSERFE